MGMFMNALKRIVISLVAGVAISAVLYVIPITDTRNEIQINHGWPVTAHCSVKAGYFTFAQLPCEGQSIAAHIGNVVFWSLVVFSVMMIVAVSKRRQAPQ